MIGDQSQVQIPPIVRFSTKKRQAKERTLQRPNLLLPAPPPPPPTLLSADIHHPMSQSSHMDRLT